MADFEDKLNSILGNQEAMGQIMALARSLSGGEEEKEQAPEAPLQESAPQQESLFDSLDPEMIQMGMRLMREFQSPDDQKTALLQALKPFLREERRQRLDRAAQIVSMSRLIRTALGPWEKRGMMRLYNRYIPNDTEYSWVGKEPEKNLGAPLPSSGNKGKSGRIGRDPLSLLLRNGGNPFPGKGGMSGLLKSLRLEELDSGDILLLLIILFLLVEGDELELVIALGLVLIIGLGDGEGKKE